VQQHARERSSAEARGDDLVERAGLAAARDAVDADAAAVRVSYHGRQLRWSRRRDLRQPRVDRRLSIRVEAGRVEVERRALEGIRERAVDGRVVDLVPQQ